MLLGEKRPHIVRYPSGNQVRDYAATFMRHCLPSSQLIPRVLGNPVIRAVTNNAPSPPQAKRTPQQYFFKMYFNITPLTTRLQSDLLHSRIPTKTLPVFHAVYMRLALLQMNIPPVYGKE